MGPTIRVLIVDDEEDMRSLAAQRLGADRRFDVVGEADDGLQAISVAVEVQPDVVLLDLEMPWLHGAEAVPLLRRDVPRALIILWTVAPDGPRAVSALELGAVAVIDKGAYTMALLPDFVLAAIERSASASLAGRHA